jgi:hypothetical protein
MRYECILLTTEERDKIVRLLSRLPRCDVQEVTQALIERHSQNGYYTPENVFISDDIT